MKTTKFFNLFLLALLCLGFASCSDDDDDNPASVNTEKKYLSKLNLTSDDESYVIDIKYNTDNTIAEYSISKDENQSYGVVFSYDNLGRVTEVKSYDEGALYETTTYKYLDGNKVEMMAIEEDSWYDLSASKPSVYTLNASGLPISMVREEYTISNADGGSYTIPAKSETFLYNADNTFSKIKDSETYSNGYNYSGTTDFVYDQDTYNPFINLPTTNLYLSTNLMAYGPGLTMTGIGALVANCTSYREYSDSDVNYDGDKYVTKYTYGEDKFPIKATVESTQDNKYASTFEVTFEYEVR